MMTTETRPRGTVIDFSRPGGNGVIRPLHGVNNGPVTFGGLVDVSDYYREVGIPWARLHDTNWPHPREVDIPQIFRQENADPDDPASYDFARTDEYLRSILATGAKIVYRLGTSIEHTKTKYDTHPPKDFARWARVCWGIVRHYNHGWANGFHHGITHWEIWNEPDLGDRMWSGTFEDYLRLYAAASATLKELDPTLKIGGYAACSLGTNGELAARFMAYCREHRLPLDFFSWHTYGAELAPFGQNARLVRRLLDQHGFHSTESHLNEWNRNIGPWGPGHEWERRAVAEDLKNEVGASYAASVLIGLQDASVDVANYYDGAPSSLLCGLFDVYGVPQKTFSAFRAFKTMLSYPERVQVELGTESGVSCLAAIDRAKGNAAVLIAKYGGQRATNRFELRGLPAGLAVREIRILDRDRNLENIRLDYAATKSPMGLDSWSFGFGIPMLADDASAAPAVVIDLAEHAVALVLLDEAAKS
ncbi:MAG: hypothetical protein WCI73_08980 [Phycisphaerae bacterium]